MEKFNRKILKKSPEELSEYLKFRSRGSRIKVKKGKGSEYNRNYEKRKVKDYDQS